MRQDLLGLLNAAVWLSGLDKRESIIVAHVVVTRVEFGRMLISIGGSGKITAIPQSMPEALPSYGFRSVKRNGLLQFN